MGDWAEASNLQVVQVPIGELRPAEYNPRATTKEEATQIKASIQRFGMVEPIVVNSAAERHNVIIGGHQRYFILQSLGWERVPVVYVAIPEVEREQELNLRLNKSVGHWDLDLLANFDERMLAEVGFSDKELADLFETEAGEDKDDPEVPFAEEMLEEHNYVVLYTEDRLDWLRFESIYPLPTVLSPRSRKGWEQKGVGRVVKLGAFLDAVFGPEQGRDTAAAVGQLEAIVARLREVESQLDYSLCGEDSFSEIAAGIDNVLTILRGVE